MEKDLLGNRGIRQGRKRITFEEEGIKCQERKRERRCKRGVIKKEKRKEQEKGLLKKKEIKGGEEENEEE